MTLSNYPPGVSGNELQISGPSREWTEVRTCPACGWEGEMAHQFHPDYGTWAFCGNPDPIDGDVDDAGRSIGVYCPNIDGGKNDGIEIFPEEIPGQCAAASELEGPCWRSEGHAGSHEGARGGSWN